jgi:hypothetical protein
MINNFPINYYTAKNYLSISDLKSCYLQKASRCAWPAAAALVISRDTGTLCKHKKIRRRG